MVRLLMRHFQVNGLLWCQ